MELPMERQTFRTGEVATRAGVNIQTLRYYERRGLIPEPDRRTSGYREYPPETVRMIRFIKRAQDLGFTLSEIEDLLRIRGDQTASCVEVRAAAKAKIDDVDLKIRSLRAMKRALAVLLSSCTSDASARECPILEALDEEPRRERRS
jgi:Hg(II)-responsive transcriptional regulator